MGKIFNTILFVLLLLSFHTKAQQLEDNNNEMSTVAIPATELNTSKQPIVAFKTNLLYHALTCLNASVEFPIKEKFSIAGEWIFPFWKAPKKDFTLNLLYGNVRLKYWFNQLHQERMTGWFCDVSFGFGKYDFQIFRKTGAQGTAFTTGIGGGYAHVISKYLRMEYALGLGFARSAYHDYYMANDKAYGTIKVVRYPWKKSHKNWIGPINAQVSLIWTINRSIIRK